MGEALPLDKFTDHGSRDDHRGGTGVYSAVRGDCCTRDNYWTDTGNRDRTVYCYAQTENIKHYEQRFVNKSSMLMVSGLVVTTCHSPHVYTSITFLGRTIIQWVDNT
jgi:hypothetical protein